MDSQQNADMSLALRGKEPSLGLLRRVLVTLLFTCVAWSVAGAQIIIRNANDPDNVQPGYTDSPTAIWATASGGTGSGPCPVSAKCTMTRALAAVSSGGIIIMTSGTYAGFDLSVNSVTITAEASAKNALTWGCGSNWVKNVRRQANCGIPSGTDNRPLITSRVTINNSGNVLEFLRIRGNTSPENDIYNGVVAMWNENQIVQYSEIFNGNQCIDLQKRRLQTIRYNYIHACGTSPSDSDTHGVQFYANNDGTSTPGTQATSFAEANTITNNTFETISGDAVQEGSIYYGCGSEGLKTHAACGVQYLIISNNHMISGEEQCFDSKGTLRVRFTGNDCLGFGQGGISVTWDPPTQSMDDWDIEGNALHGMGYAYTPANSPNHCLRHNVWNNVIYDNVGDTGFNIGAFMLCGGSTHNFVFNTLYNNKNGNGSGAKTWGLSDDGAGANVRNNIYYSNGTGTGRGHMSDVSPDSGTPVGNYVNNPTLITDCGAGCKIGTSTVSTCFAALNCPGFTNIAAADFTLQTGSPAIDAAVAQDIGSHASLTDSGFFTPSIDAKGVTRSTTSPDLGAFEYVAPEPLLAAFLRLQRLTKAVR